MGKFSAGNSKNVFAFSSKLASNFSNLFENLKQQALPTQADSPQTSHDSESDQSAHSSFLQDGPADESTDLVDKTVQVKHRSHYRRPGKSSAGQTTEPQIEHKEEQFQKTNNETTVVCVENLDKLLGG